MLTVKRFFKSTELTSVFRIQVMSLCNLHLSVRKSEFVCFFLVCDIILYKVQRHRPAVVVNGLISYCVHLMLDQGMFQSAFTVWCIRDTGSSCFWSVAHLKPFKSSCLLFKTHRRLNSCPGDIFWYHQQKSDFFFFFAKTTS